MKLYLDDVRECPKGWIPVRNVRDMIQLLQEQDVSEISLDHDLGELEPVGLAVLDWIEREVFEGEYNSPKMYVHSWNPAGRKSMLLAIKKIESLVKERPIQKIVDLMHLSGVGAQEVEDLKNIIGEMTNVR